MTFLMYGAGSIGRGFIGPMFARAGYEVAFVDIDRNVINALNERRGYKFTIAADPPYDEYVGEARGAGGGSGAGGVRGVETEGGKATGGVRGVDGADAQAVAREIAECGLMATSLGAAALKRVAPLIAKGFSLRMKTSGEPLDILICENLKDSAALLREWISSELNDEDKRLFTEKCGLVETAVGRMIPPGAGAISGNAGARANDIIDGACAGVIKGAPGAAKDVLHLTVEEYGYLPADKDAFKGRVPAVPELVPHSPFSFYEERKLYLHNMSHAVCAYLGIKQGHTTIAQAVSDPFVRLATQSAMTESASMLSIKYGVPYARIFDHAEDLLYRYGNEALGDTCERVGRDPMRKLAAGDRLSGALKQCEEHGVYPVYIMLGYAAALRNVTGDPARAAQIAADDGQLTPSQAHLVMELFGAYEMPPAQLLRAAERIKKGLRGNII